MIDSNTNLIPVKEKISLFGQQAGSKKVNDSFTNTAVVVAAVEMKDLESHGADTQ